MTRGRPWTLCLAASAAWVLQACAQPAGGGSGAEPRQQPAQCRASAAQFAIGQQPEPAIVDKAQRAAQADTVRVIRHNQMVTKEYRVGRLNLHLDESGRIVRVNCG